MNDYWKILQMTKYSWKIIYLFRNQYNVKTIFILVAQTNSNGYIINYILIGFINWFVNTIVL